MSTAPVNPISADVAAPSAPRRRGADVSGEGFDRALEEVLVGRAAPGHNPGSAASRGVAFGLSQLSQQSHSAADAPGGTAPTPEVGASSADASSASSSSPVVDAALQALVGQAQAAHAWQPSSDNAQQSVTVTGLVASDAVTAPGAGTGASVPVAVAAAAPGGAVPETQMQSFAADEVVPIDNPGGAVLTAPAPGGSSPESPVTPVAPQPPAGTPGAGSGTPPPADDPAVPGVPSAPLPGTWGDAVAPVPVPGVGGVTPGNPTAPLADDRVGLAPEDSAPPVATAPVATAAPGNGDPGSTEGETDTPEQPIPLPTPDAVGDPDSDAADGTLPNVITPPSRGTLNPDVPTSVVQPIAADLDGPAPSAGLLSPQIQDLLEVGGQGAQSTARTLLVPPPAPVIVPAPTPSTATPEPAPSATPAPTAWAPPAAPVAGLAARSTSTAAQTPEPAPSATAQSQAAAERVVPAFTVPSQPVASPVAPTPSAILTGTPGALPHQQVATAVGPLLRGPDGSYLVQLNLLPAHLGQVRISVKVRGSEVAVQMLTIDNNARDLLRGNLDSLRQDLQQMGLRSGYLDVSGGRDGSQRRWNEQGFGDLSGGGRGSGGRGQHGPAHTLDNEPADGPLTSDITTRPTREGDTLDVRV